MRVTLDTNVYISALNFGGGAARLLGMARAGMIHIDISGHIEGEIVRVLREDFGWEGYRLHFMREGLAKITHRVTPSHTVNVVDDPDDNRIIECAIAAGSDCIVTNDKALLRLGQYEGIPIIRLADFLQHGMER